MGWEKEVLKQGAGNKPRKGQTVKVHCTGYLQEGMKKFWSTKDRGQQAFSFEVGLGKVVRGWDEGVMSMQLGEEARLTCTHDYAYGERGFPAWGIGPRATLVFDIEVLEIK